VVCVIHPVLVNLLAAPRLHFLQYLSQIRFPEMVFQKRNQALILDHDVGPIKIQ